MCVVNANASYDTAPTNQPKNWDKILKDEPEDDGAERDDEEFTVPRSEAQELLELISSSDNSGDVEGETNSSMSSKHSDDDLSL